MKNNPWKGLVSYEEKDLEKYEFCGRTKAIGRYYSLITGNLFSTLYGKTGCGKTSMLQAGIFPLLRQESYFPVMCRLSSRNEKTSCADYLIERVEQEISNLGYSFADSNVSVNHVEELEKYKLWKYFYGHVFLGKDNNVVFPVIVLDQFEEILINSKNESLKFLEQVGFLVGDNLLLPDDCYANFRVTMSLREDYLYLLEDTIDEGNLYGLRNNRMRLTPLSIDEAKEVISLGDDFIRDTDREEIYKDICKLANNRRGYISTNILSLICSQLYHIYSKKQANELVTLDDMKHLSEDPLRDFYRNCVKEVQKKTITFIENELVLDEFRRPVTKQEFESKVPASDRDILTKGETKILQFITANDNECVELIHDTLAKTIFRFVNEKKGGMFKKPFSFSGRIRRLEYAISLLIYYAYCITCALLHYYAYLFSEFIVKEVRFGILLIFNITIYWFLFAQGCKRCHDRGRSGWFQLIPFYFLVLLFGDGEPGENKFGNNPKE